MLPYKTAILMQTFQQSVFLRNAVKETGYDLHAFGVGSGSHVGLYSKI